MSVNTQQLTPVGLQALLQLRVLKPITLSIIKPQEHRLKLLTRAGESIGPLRCHTITFKIRCNTPLGPALRQDFYNPRVKFLTTGAKVGDHCGHLSWSTLI